MTDLMVGKLAGQAWGRMDTLTPGEITRDEVRLVITDTAILCESDDPRATLDRWQEGQ
jgi:hypothetical protein